MATKSNYVKFYKECLGISFSGKEYDIHHIDSNRDNNDLSNLLLLPKSLHHKYHFMYPPEITLEWGIKSACDRGNAFNWYALNMFQNFIVVYNECCRWADYKEYLLGNIPNIHGLSL